MTRRTHTVPSAATRALPRRFGIPVLGWNADAEAQAEAKAKAKAHAKAKAKAHAKANAKANAQLQRQSQRRFSSGLGEMVAAKLL